MDKVYCTHCGTPNELENNFCIKCGAPLISNLEQNKTVQYNRNSGNSFIDSTTRTVNGWAGEDKTIHINLGDFFSEVFKSHSQAEAEDIFIAGTQKTTPTLEEISSDPVHPWLYSRAFMGMMVALGLLFGLMFVFGNNIMSLFTVLLSIAVPISLLIFFFEVNAFKNISFYLTIKICLIGGIFSLIVTMLLYVFVGSNYGFDILGSTIIGLIEETGKLLVGCYFVSRLRLTHVFNGMLVGGAIGAGFAAIENIQYANATQSDFLVPILRSIGSLGTHAIWCAITVSAVVLVNGNREFKFHNIENLSFFRFFICAVVLHALWDWDTPFTYFKMIILICAGWIILFVLIHTGLREVKFIQNRFHART